MIYVPSESRRDECSLKMKIITLLLACCAAVGMLTGCSRTNTETSQLSSPENNTNNPESREPVTEEKNGFRTIVDLSLIHI